MSDSQKQPRATSARAVAETALARVLEDGAFAAAALDAEFERTPQLDARERALATNLLYGTLRVFPFLERAIDEHAKRSVQKQRPRVRAAMTLAAYQILLMDRIPPYAAVSEAVDAVRAASDDKVGGFANAVLRKLAANALSNGRPSLVEALRASMPHWLLKSLARTLGEDQRDALLALGSEAPPAGLVVADPSTRDSWIARLRAVEPNATFEPGKISPHAILVRNAGRPADLVGVATGELTVQEEGSQLVALALGAQLGERVLDACAGRGHKTALLARAVGEGVVDAADLHESKLARLAIDLDTAGLRVGDRFAVDWSVGSGDVPYGYDAALVDAPCSGTGTLRRRPDILLRRRKQDVLELAALQRAIVTRVAEHVKPGGRLVYAVCSLLREEAEDVLDAADLESLGFRPAPFPGPAARAIFGDATTGRLLPHVHGTDGYFLASFVRARDTSTSTGRG